MSKICITSYYGLRESLFLASNELIKLGHYIYNYSLMQRMGEVENYDDEFIDYIISNGISVVLWWFVRIPADKLHNIILKTNKLVKHIYYNWDDPPTWSSPAFSLLVKHFDAVYASCEETLNLYLQAGVKEAYHLLAGFSPNTNFILDDDNIGNKYSCDISFACTNLYENKNEFPNQYINRKKLIDDIYKNQEKYGYTFHIYGPENIGREYPKSYKGFIHYDNLNLLFNKSRINLCTHCVSNKRGYFNERTFQIAGSGGLLLIDYIPDIEKYLKPNEECIVLDKDNYVEQIANILTNYDEYIGIRINLYNKSKDFSWEKWANTIHETFLSRIL